MKLPNSFASLVSDRRTLEKMTNKVFVLHNTSATRLMEQMNGTKDDQTAETGFSLQLESSQEGHFTGTKTGSK